MNNGFSEQPGAIPQWVRLVRPIIAISERIESNLAEHLEELPHLEKVLLTCQQVRGDLCEAIARLDRITSDDKEEKNVEDPQIEGGKFIVLKGGLSSDETYQEESLADQNDDDLLERRMRALEECPLDEGMTREDRAEFYYEELESLRDEIWIPDDIRLLLEEASNPKKTPWEIQKKISTAVFHVITQIEKFHDELTSANEFLEETFPLETIPWLVLSDEHIKGVKQVFAALHVDIAVRFERFCELREQLRKLSLKFRELVAFRQSLKELALRHDLEQGAREKREIDDWKKKLLSGEEPVVSGQVPVSHISELIDYLILPEVANPSALSGEMRTLQITKIVFRATLREAKGLAEDIQWMMRNNLK